MTKSIETNNFSSILLASFFICAMFTCLIVFYQDAKLKTAWNIFKETKKWKTPTFLEILEFMTTPLKIRKVMAPKYFKNHPKNEVTIPILKKIKIYLIISLTCVASEISMLYFYF